MDVLQEVIDLAKSEGLTGPLAFWLKFKIYGEVVVAVIVAVLFIFSARRIWRNIRGMEERDKRWNTR